MRSSDTWRILSLVNNDEAFRTNERNGLNPIILNQRDMSDPNTMDELHNLIFSQGEGADFVAKCQCENLEGNNKIGMTCNICNTKVSEINLLDSDNLVCKNWLSCPSEIPNGWLSPKIYLALASWLSYDKGRRNKRNYLDDILDVDSVLPFELQDIIQGRGFKYLYDNFDRIISYFAFDHPVISKRPTTQAIRFCLELYRDRIFCHYVPILNSAINPIVSSDTSGVNKRKYTNTTADHVLKAAITLSHLEYSNTKKKNRQAYVERLTFQAYKGIIVYNEEATSKYLSVKKAIPRMHIFGSRFHWSFRGVIVPIIGPHKPHELHFPWQMAVNSFRVHIIGILTREYNMRLNDAVSKVRRALMIVDEDIRIIMDRLITESPFPGIPVLWDRPPSIRDGSVMLKYITKIKTDIDDACIGITPIDVKLPNADFDGDNLAGIILTETEMVKKMQKLSPTSLIHDRNSGNVSDEIKLAATLSIPWNSFLETV